MPIAVAQFTLHRSSVAKLATGAYRFCILQVSAAAAAAKHNADLLICCFHAPQLFLAKDFYRYE